MNARQESDFHPEIPSTARYRRILVATNGSDCSTLAVYLAETLGARLYALYSVDVQRAFHVGIHFGEAVVELKKFGHEAVSAVRVLAEGRGLACEEIVAEGTPHRSIIRASDEIEADLIVLGSTGMTSLERALIGSESQKVSSTPNARSSSSASLETRPPQTSFSRSLAPGCEKARVVLG